MIIEKQFQELYIGNIFTIGNSGYMYIKIEQINEYDDNAVALNGEDAGQLIWIHPKMKVTVCQRKGNKMQIEKIESLGKKDKYVIITLSKEELLDMANLILNYPEFNKQLINSIKERRGR